MDDKTLKNAVSELRKSEKKNFKQTVDLIINLRGLDLKKPEHQVEFFLELPKGKGRKTKVCALVGPELADQAGKVMDAVVLQNQFANYEENKKLAKKLAGEHDFFVAQANIMPKVATSFGRVLGPKGKMPNPKAGCIVPPNANLKTLYDKLQKTVKISGKKAALIQTIIGNQESSDEDLIENIKVIYNNLSHNLPNAEYNIKSGFIKYTRGKPVRII